MLTSRDPHLLRAGTRLGETDGAEVYAGARPYSAPDVGSDRGSLAERRHRKDHAGALADRRLRTPWAGRARNRRRPAGEPFRLLRHRPQRRADAWRRPPGPG